MYICQKNIDELKNVSCDDIHSNNIDKSVNYPARMVNIKQTMTEYKEKISQLVS